MIRYGLLLGLTAIPTSQVRADPRIATHFYQPSEIVPIHGRVDIQSTIAFAPEERIENVAVGDSASWQAVPNKRADLLFLKPLSPLARTNMTVVTDQRTYLFDLLPTSGRSPSAVYMLRFSYPPVPPKPVVSPSPDVVGPRPATPDPVTFDFAWVARGDKTLFPTRIFDDGHATYLTWPKDAPLPAIFTRDAKGAEGPVNYTTRGEYVVVDGVPAQLDLRMGKQIAQLTPDHARDTLGPPDAPDAPDKTRKEPGPSDARIASRIP